MTEIQEIVLALTVALVWHSLVAFVVLRRRKTKEARRRTAVEAGQPFELTTALRFPGRSGYGRRWRLGIVYRDDYRLRFRPHWYRPGRRFDMTGFVVSRVRPATKKERVRSAGSAVVVGEGPEGTAEFGFGNYAAVSLFRILAASDYPVRVSPISDR